MKPSGDPVPDRPTKNGDQKTPGKDPPVEQPPPRTDDATGVPLTPLALSVIVKPSRKGLYPEHIVPVLETSCTTGGCHTASETIDLRSFPFQAEGSYAMDDIISALGPNPDPDEVQKRLVQVLISSMHSGYMPPSVLDPVSEEDSSYFQKWLDGGLSVEAPPFLGSFRIQGISNSEVVCEASFEMKSNVLDTKIDRDSCKTAERIEFVLLDAADQRIDGSHIEFKEFALLKNWKLTLGQEVAIF